jgi:Winged helix-turn helix
LQVNPTTNMFGHFAPSSFQYLLSASTGTVVRAFKRARRPNCHRNFKPLVLRQFQPVVDSIQTRWRKHPSLPPVAGRPIYVEHEYSRARWPGRCERKTPFERLVDLRKGHRQETSKSTVYNLLARHGWRKLMPRPFHLKRDIAAQNALKKTIFLCCEESSAGCRQARPSLAHHVRR